MHKLPINLLLVTADPAIPVLVTSLVPSLIVTLPQILPVPSLAAAKEVLLKKQKIDVIVTELQLPDAAGPAIIAELHPLAQIEDIPIIVLTPSSSLSSVQECIQRGAHSLLLKEALPLMLDTTLLVAKTHKETLVANTNLLAFVTDCFKV